MKKRVKRAASRIETGFAIINPWGDFWSPHLFDSPESAERHFNQFWQSPGFKGKEPSWEQYRVVRARQTLTHTGEA